MGFYLLPLVRFVVVRFWRGSRVPFLKSMGPISLFDKSFLQSLSADEALWFDHFSLPVVCPIFYVETLADLAKKASNRTAENVVADIRAQIPRSGSPCHFHNELCFQNLLGAEVVMDERIPRPGGRPVRGSTVFEHTRKREE